MRRKNDALWKGILEEVFEDFMRFFFPDADKDFVLEKGFEFLNKELNEISPEPHRRSDTRNVDKLVKVCRRDGIEEWIRVHVEVQNHLDPEFAKRMFRYYYRIFDRYDRPLTAIAIFAGKDGMEMPDRYESNYAGTSLVYRYNTLRIQDCKDDDLISSVNPFALVLLAAKRSLVKGICSDGNLLQQKLAVARILIERGLFDKPKIAAIFSFLNNYVLFENPETNRIFMEQIDQYTGKTNTMGIIEQVAEMRAEQARIEKEKAVVSRLLTMNMHSTKEIATIVGVSISFVEKIRKNGNH